MLVALAETFVRGDAESARPARRPRRFVAVRRSGPAEPAAARAAADGVARRQPGADRAGRRRSPSMTPERPGALPPRLGGLAAGPAAVGLRRLPQAADVPGLRGPGGDGTRRTRGCAAIGYRPGRSAGDDRAGRRSGCTMWPLTTPTGAVDDADRPRRRRRGRRVRGGRRGRRRRPGEGRAIGRRPRGRARSSTSGRCHAPSWTPSTGTTSTTA